MLVVTQPLPKNGGVAEGHGAPEAGQLLRREGKQRKSLEEVRVSMSV